MDLGHTFRKSIALSRNADSTTGLRRRILQNAFPGISHLPLKRERPLSPGANSAGAFFVIEPAGRSLGIADVT